jgi:uncharacterized protein YndB with AHSA1/START domain
MRTRHFTLYIAATREQAWRALTDPAMTRRFYFGLAVESRWRAGSPIAYRSAPGQYPAPVVLAGEIVHVEPGRRLVHSLVSDTDAEADREAQCWVTWDLDEPEPGICRVALTCDDLDRCDDPERDESWCRLLSGLKTVLETGAGMAGACPGPADDAVPDADDRGRGGGGVPA